jgi:hypothetical protein
MAKWTINDDKAILDLLGGRLIVRRDRKGLTSSWSSPNLPALVVTRTPHVTRFAIEPDVISAVDRRLSSAMLDSKWLGVMAQWPKVPSVMALEAAIHGTLEQSGTGSWIHPVAVRDHLAKCYPEYLEPFAAESPPPIFAAAADPI